jgi:hypothetical protein
MLILEREELENMKDINEYLDDILEIRRIQTLTDEGWKTYEYELLSTFGGPNIIINSEGIMGTWYEENDFIRHSEKSKLNFNKICDFLKYL